MKRYINKICLPYLVPEIQLFVYILVKISKWPRRPKNGPRWKFLLFLITKSCFWLFKVHKRAKKLGLKSPYDGRLAHLEQKSKQTADLWKKCKDTKLPALDEEHFVPNRFFQILNSLVVAGQKVFCKQTAAHAVTWVSARSYCIPRYGFFIRNKMTLVSWKSENSLLSNDHFSNWH